MRFTGENTNKIVLFSLIFGLMIMAFGVFVYMKSEKNNPDHYYALHMYDKYVNEYDYEGLDTIYISEKFLYQLPTPKTLDIWTYWFELNLDTCEINYFLSDYTTQDDGIDEIPVSVGTFSEQDKKNLLAILQKNQVLDWKPGIYYEDQSHGLEPAAYQMNSDAEYRKIGEYFRISSGMNQYYNGLSKKEKISRERCYESVVRFGTDSSDLKYSSYGLPENYNEFMKEIWDFVFAHVDAEDYRKNLDKKVTEKRKAQNVLTEGLPDLNHLEYFSLEEFFGGFDSGIKVSLKFDEGLWKEKSLHGDYEPYKEIYAMDKDGIPNLLGEPDEKTIQLISDIIPYGQVRDTDTETNKKLIDILKKYKVLEWRDKDYYAVQPDSAYVIQGDFFNMKPGLSEEEKQMDEKEYAIRSSYNGFIDLYDTEGRRISLQYDNHGVPEEYQEFRQELWDFAINYMSEGDRNKRTENDWRNYIDQAGREYLELENNETN